MVKNFRNISKLGKIIGLMSAIIFWRLWLRRCKTRMEGNHDSRDVGRLVVKYWLAKTLEDIRGSLTMKAKAILEDLQLHPTLPAVQAPHNIV